MATTENSYTTSNATTTDFAFTFPYMKEADVNIDVAGTKQATTAYSFHNATTIRLTTAPASGVAVKVYRTTDDSGLTSTFYPGSAIRSGDLNDNFTQNLYSTQESINESTLATTTAEGAVTTANAATATANTASTNASAAVTTANTASTNASAAVTTANTASTNASAAVTTANTANTTAASAVTTANAATTTANSATTTANAADTKADTAISTANTASTNATAAVSTANTASTNATSAVSTANTASTNASAAVTTANTASTNASAAVVTANAAAADVAAAVLYSTVANKAALEALTPTADSYYQTTDSTGLANGTFTNGGVTYTVASIPGTYPNTQLSGITTKFSYTHSSKTYTYASYFANDGDDRYMVGPASDGSNGQYLQTNGSGVKSWATVDTSTLAPKASPAFTGDATFAGDLTVNTDALFVDASTKVTSIGGDLRVGSQTAIDGVPLEVEVTGSNAGAVGISLINTKDSDASATCIVRALQDGRRGGDIVFGRENAGDWSASAASADGFISFNPALNGSAVESMRINSSGSVLIGPSGAPATTITAAGAITPTDGLYLGGTGAANHLDDYEEGTWTPALSGDWSSITYTIQRGRYIKIGNLVYLYYTLQMSAATSPGGGYSFSINGIPFTGYDYLAGYFGGGISIVNLDIFLTDEWKTVYYGGGTTAFSFRDNGGNTSVRCGANITSTSNGLISGYLIYSADTF